MPAKATASAACSAYLPELGLAQDASATLLMVLSPRMVYALKEWPRMQAVAQAAGFRVLALRDPRVPLDEWQAAVQTLGLHDAATLPPIPLPMAARCGLLNHMPSSLLVRCQRAHPWPVLGVMPDKAWRAVLRQRDEWLKEQACN